MNELEEFEFRRRREQERSANVPQEAPQPGVKDKLLGSAARIISAGPAGLFPALNNEAQQYSDHIVQNAANYSGGAVTDFAAQHGASPEMAGGLGYATNVGIKSVPVVASMLMGRAMEPTMKDAARGLMTSAVKPTLKQHQTGEAARGVEALLEEGYNPTASGVKQMQSRVRDLDKQVEEDRKSVV